MLNTNQLTALITNGAIKNVILIGQDNGFFIKINDSILEARRGNPRHFKKLETAAEFLKERGIGSFFVEVNNWTPKQKSMV